jgi:hypothetical protein
MGYGMLDRLFNSLSDLLHDEIKKQEEAIKRAKNGKR